MFCLVFAYLINTISFDFVSFCFAFVTPKVTFKNITRRLDSFLLFRMPGIFCEFLTIGFEIEKMRSHAFEIRGIKAGDPPN